jgi:hypothetical protein
MADIESGPGPVPVAITNLTQIPIRKHNDLQAREAPIPHIVLSKLQDVPEFQQWMKKRMGHQADATITGAAGQNNGIAITFDGTNIWVSLYTIPVQILKIDPATNTIVATVTGAAGQNSGIAITFDGTNIWVSVYTIPAQILKIDPATNAIVATVTGAAGQDRGYGITFDGTNIWVALNTVPVQILKKYAYLRKVDSFFRKRTDVTVSRALNTTYTNSDTNRTLHVIATVGCVITVAAGTAFAQGKADTSTPPVTAASGIVGIQAGLLGEDNSYEVNFYVMPLEKYRIDSTAVNGTTTLGNWFETLI